MAVGSKKAQLPNSRRDRWIWRSKGYKFLSSSNIYILNYEGVKAELDIVELLLESQKFIIVLDESQRIKNPLSKTFLAIAKLIKYPGSQIYTE